jgi:hypothetical protein
VSRNARFAIAAVAVILVVGVVVSQFASSAPDGLNYVAEQEGFSDSAQDHPLDATPLANYGNDGLSRAIAALVGIAVTLGAGYVVFHTIGSHDTHDSTGD